MPWGFPTLPQLFSFRTFVWDVAREVVADQVHDHNSIHATMGKNSMHALMKGATRQRARCENSDMMISIHAPTQDVA